MENVSNPRLIEPGVKGFLQNTLHRCHDNRVKLYTWFFNIGILIVFFGIFGAALYYCYKKKLSPEEQYQKMVKDQAYILSKIRFYQNERLDHPLSSISSLPMMDDPMDRLRL